MVVKLAVVVSRIFDSENDLSSALRNLYVICQISEYIFTAEYNRYHMKPIPSVLLFHPCLQLADLLLSDYLAEIKIEGSAISSFVAVSILQELRLELKVIQTRIYEDYKKALESIADVLPYFPDGHFAGRVNGLQIWRRPLLSVTDGHVDYVFTKVREDLYNGAYDYPKRLLMILDEHLAAYFEILYDMLRAAEKTNQEKWGNLDKLVLNLTNRLETYSDAAVMNENFIK